MITHPLYFDEHEVLCVAAKHLVGGKGIFEVEASGIPHLMFDQHEVVLSDGAWTERPGDYSLNGMGNAQRNEIYKLFPKLQAGLEDYTAARPTFGKP